MIGFRRVIPNVYLFRLHYYSFLALIFLKVLVSSLKFHVGLLVQQYNKLVQQLLIYPLTTFIMEGTICLFITII